MVRGLYTAYTGMVNEQKRLDIISNNLANAATTGYKEESVTSQAFEQVLAIKIRDGSEAYINRGIGSMSLGVKLGEVYTNYEQGSVRSTGNTLDLAMNGKGFFALKVYDKMGNASIKYTRDGSFQINKDGYLTDASGNRVQGSAGDIMIPTDAINISIDRSGTIVADGTTIDSIQITDFENYDYLKKFGENMYEAVDGATMTDAEGTVEQGYTEQSNVNVVAEMVDMITITRAYEANSKVVKAVDSMLDKSVNSVGKV